MALTDSQKKLILQTVHCTKYLKPTHATYSLEHNDKDNNWYYRKNWNKEQYDGKAGFNTRKWRHNRKYELRDKSFSGVVVKIHDILLSSTLGIYAISSNDLEACSFAPSKSSGFFITVATVFFRNGCKRLVPLDCIIEYDGFTDGVESEKLYFNLETVINSEPARNKISLKDDGTIEIENDYNYINSSDGNLINSKRYLLLNVKKRNARIYADTDDEWWHISNDEYSAIMEIMNQQMKEECGFVPDLSYGETNFDRLVNFANYPFAPELNVFSSMYSKDKPGSIKTDCNGINYIVPAGLEESLKNNPSAVGEFIKNCGITYTPKINKIFLKGHRDFLEYLGIWYTGFRDDKDIEKIMEADTQKLFSKAVSDTANFGTYFEDDSQNETVLQTCLCFRQEPNLFYDIRYLFHLYDVKTALKLTLELVTNKSHYSTPDAMEYLLHLDYENLLTPDIIKKIGKEGFTDYNHNLLMRLFRDTHPAPDECLENKEIAYSDEEQKLVWEKSGYSFMLPEDTNRLVDIGSKMNICVGHLYRNKAASKQCIIVYAKKDDKYELCIELKQNSANNFLLVQKSAFSNSAPRGELLDVFNQWCKINEIKQA